MKNDTLKKIWFATCCLIMLMLSGNWAGAEETVALPEYDYQPFILPLVMLSIALTFIVLCMVLAISFLLTGYRQKL